MKDGFVVGYQKITIKPKSADGLDIAKRRLKQTKIWMGSSLKA